MFKKYSKRDQLKPVQFTLGATSTCLRLNTIWTGSGKIPPPPSLGKGEDITAERASSSWGQTQIFSVTTESVVTITNCLNATFQWNPGTSRWRLQPLHMAWKMSQWLIAETLSRRHLYWFPAVSQIFTMIKTCLNCQSFIACHNLIICSDIL